MEMLRLNDHPGMRLARRILHEINTVFVSFAAQGTHIPLLIVHTSAVKHYGYADGFGYPGVNTTHHYVSYMEFGGAYPLQLGCLHPGYVQEKLQMRHKVDALNVTGFLNALGQDTVAELNEYLAGLRMDPRDDTALDFDHYQREGGPL